MLTSDKSSMSAFSLRLAQLMEVNNLKSPRMLAEQLYDAGLVKVNSQIYDEPSKRRANAIGSIIKKIQAHLKAEDASAVQGEFLIAYSRFFEVSTDYILGLSDYISSDREIEDISQKTGLGESALIRLIHSSSIPEQAWRAGFWSRLMSGNMYGNLSNAWQVCLQNFVREQEAQYHLGNAISDMHAAKDPEEKRQLRIVVDSLTEDYNKAFAAYDGSVFNAGRFLMNYFEQELNSLLQETDSEED